MAYSDQDMADREAERSDEDLSGWIADLLRPAFWITVVYAIAVLLCFELLMPIQAASFPDYESYASLFYLPHVVRLMVAWWFGPLALWLLLPGVMGEVLYLYGGEAGWIDYGVATLTIIGPVLAFPALARLGYDCRPRRGNRVRWPDLVLVGAVSSLIGLLGPTLVYQNTLGTLAAWFLGDITGMLLVFLPVALIFQIKRT